MCMFLLAQEAGLFDNLNWIGSLGSAAAAVVVVWMFLADRKQERTSTAATEKVRTEGLKTLQDTILAHNTDREDELKKTIDHNSTVVERNTEVLGAVKQVIEHLSRE